MQPDIFCFTFGTRTARSAMLLGRYSVVADEERYSVVADEEQYGVGVQAEAPQQIVVYRLFDASARS